MHSLLHSRTRHTHTQYVAFTRSPPHSQVLAVSQSYAGSAGRRVALMTEHQIWTKPLGRHRHAVLVLSNASTPISVEVALGTIDPELNATGRPPVHARDLYAHRELGRVRGGTWVATDLAPHDSTLIVFSVHAGDEPS